MKNVTRLKLMAEITNIILDAGDLTRWTNETILHLGETCKSLEEFLERAEELNKLVGEVSAAFEADGVVEPLIRLRFATGGSIPEIMKEFGDDLALILRTACDIYGAPHRRNYVWLEGDRGRHGGQQRPTGRFASRIASVKDFIECCTHYSWDVERAAEESDNKDSIEYVNDKVYDEVQKFLAWMIHNKVVDHGDAAIADLMKDMPNDDVNAVCAWVERINPHAK